MDALLDNFFFLIHPRLVGLKGQSGILSKVVYLKYLSSLFTLEGNGQCSQEWEDRTRASIRFYVVCGQRRLLFSYSKCNFWRFASSKRLKPKEYCITTCRFLAIVNLIRFLSVVDLNNLCRDKLSKVTHTKIMHNLYKGSKRSKILGL